MVLGETLEDSTIMSINDGTRTRMTGPENAKKVNAPDVTIIDNQLNAKATWTTFKDNMGSDHPPTFTHVGALSFYKEKQPRKLNTSGINDLKFST